MAGSMTKAQAQALAPTYLKAINAPVTKQNVDAMTAWMMLEGGYANNNPLNIKGTGPCGKGGYLNMFAVYCTPQQGADAFASNLTSSWGKQYGYDGIVAGFQNGNGNDAVQAIINSGWVTGKTGGSSYQHGSNNSLSQLYSEYSGQAISGSTLLDYAKSKGITPSSDTLTPSLLAQLVPLMAKDTGEANDTFLAYYGDYLGKPLNQAPAPNAVFNSSSFGGAARSPGLPFADVATALSWFATHLVPAGAMLLGGAFVVIGSILVAKGSGGEGGSTTIQPTMPILLKEGA